MGNNTLKNGKNIFFIANEKKVGFSLEFNLAIVLSFKALLRVIVILL
ncbi:hypothetical protein [Flavobacterium sp. MMS24-S5]